MSQRHGAIGYCVMIRQLMRPIIVRHGDITDQADKSDAEIVALRIGVSLCPRDTDGVIAYTDLNDLPAMMQGVNVSYQARIARALLLLDVEAAAFASVEYRVVDRMNSLYRQCHTWARYEAAKAAMLRGFIGRKAIRSPAEQEPKQEKRIGLKLPKRKWPITWTSS